MMSANDWGTAASISTCVSCIIALLGIAFLIWEIIQAKKALNANICCNLFELWMSKEMENKRWLCKGRLIWPLNEGKWETWETYSAFRETLEDIEGESGRTVRDEINKALFGIWDFFEHMGVLVKHGGLDIRVVQEYWEASLPTYWEPFEAVIKDIRGESSMFANFEDLYRELKDPAA